MRRDPLSQGSMIDKGVRGGVRECRHMDNAQDSTRAAPDGDSTDCTAVNHQPMSMSRHQRRTWALGQLREYVQEALGVPP